MDELYMTVNTKDLMIGDRVKQKHSGLLLKVCAIEPPYIRAEGEEGQFHEDTIEPIPLTDEILKKNGFQYYHKNYASLSCVHPFKLRMNVWPDENGKGGLWSVGGIINVRYVHELQRALKVCEVDKEIK